MPQLQLDGVRIHYRDTGTGAPLLFLHGFLWDGRLFDAQVAALAPRYRCVCPDFRGQGGSEATAGGYDLDTQAGDIAGLIEALNLGPCHLVGVSMGGFVALRLAVTHPGLVRSLCLIGTSAAPEPPLNQLLNGLLTLLIRGLGLKAALGAVVPKLLGRPFRRDPTQAARRQALRQRLAANTPRGILPTIAAMSRRPDQRADLHRIACPTLVLAGDQDRAIPPRRGRALAAAIAGARLEMIDGAGHSAPLERPDRVTAALDAFLAPLRG